MHILITGATGLIGKAIIKLCLKKQYTVNYLTTNKNKIDTTSKTKGFYWNPSKNEIDLECFKGVNAIINLAGAPIFKKWTPKYKNEIINSRTQSIELLNNSLKKIKHEVECFVTASAIGVYPNSLTNFYNEDEAQIDNSFLGDVVKKWENKADVLSVNNIRVAKIRIGLVLSKNGGALPQIANPIKFYMGSAFGSGAQWQSWIHITDLARLFLFVVENKLAGIYNAVAPKPVTNRELTEEVARVLKKTLILPNIPEFMMKLVLGEMSYLLYVSQMVSSKKIEDLGFVFNHFNLKSSLGKILDKIPDTTE